MAQQSCGIGVTDAWRRAVRMTRRRWTAILYDWSLQVQLNPPGFRLTASFRRFFVFYWPFRPSLFSLGLRSLLLSLSWLGFTRGPLRRPSRVVRFSLFLMAGLGLSPSPGGGVTRRPPPKPPECWCLRGDEPPLVRPLIACGAPVPGGSTGLLPPKGPDFGQTSPGGENTTGPGPPFWGPGPPCDHERRPDLILRQATVPLWRGVEETQLSVVSA